MLLPGDTLNRGAYRIEQELGAGGFGVVYLAQEVMIPRRVAIKTILPEVAARDRNAAEGFYNEARMTAGLEHPYIIPIYYVGQDDVRGALVHYIVMEYVEGGDLESAMQREALDLAQRLRWMRQIAEGLDHAHQQGVIHRDLKLRNVFLTRNRNVKIGDFGLAKALGSETRTIMKGLGTPAYVSPEQIQGKRTDVRADIYSLGVMYYQLATTRLPFDVPETTDPNSKIMAICYQHVNAPVPSARALRPDLPGTLDALIQRMMAKAPEDRPQSVAEVSATLAGVTLGGASDGPTPAVRWAAVAVAILLVSGAGYGAYRLWPQQQLAVPPPPTPGPEPRVMKAELEEQLRRAGLDVKAEVSASGVVTLTGVVKDEVQRGRAVSLARGVPGVTEVRSAVQLTQPVPPKPGPEPRVMKAELEEQLRRAGLEVKAEVSATGVVTLTGVVRDEAQRGRAVSLARGVPGVTEVRSTVQVAQPAPPRPGPDPRAMKADLEGQLRRGGLEVKAEVSATGVVTLTGVVRDEAQRGQAVSLARSVPGVTEVKSAMQLARPPGPDPGVMKTELEHQLRRASLDLRVDVTSSGIVTLIGVVDDQNQKERAVSLAKGVPGVADVRAQINVRKQWGQ